MTSHRQDSAQTVHGIPLTTYTSNGIIIDDLGRGIYGRVWRLVGRSHRVLFAFDPRRCAILLLGGDKTGDDRWFDENVPIADRLYDVHLEALKREGLKDG